jgi:serine/threonine-protein kinase
LIHRDVKPENVMVRVDGAVKVLDFGLARAVTSEDEPRDRVRVAGGFGTRDSAFAGTPRYMAPEQLGGEPLDARTDQFSWGVLAYELLTGRAPWGGERATLSLHAAILTEHPESPSAIDANVPENVAGAVMRALAKTPGERFASMDDLLAGFVERSGNVLELKTVKGRAPSAGR